MGPASVALLWLVLAGAGRAAEGDETPSAASPSEQDRLEQAVTEYQSGRWDAAQLALTLLISDASVSQAVQQEARIYLGEVLYARGDEEGARKIFEQVLTIDPDFQVDPFRHPPEILAQFEVARSSVAPFPRPELVQAKFSSTFLPLGIYQLRHERPAMGAMFLVTQVGLAATSLTMWISLLPDEERRYDAGSPEEASARTRTTVQLVTGWAAVGSYMWGFLDAQHQWRTERARNVATGLPPVGLTVSGRL
jgi:tetratricopeptide (TPR) repeat protein